MSLTSLLILVFHIFINSSVGHHICDIIILSLIIKTVLEDDKTLMMKLNSLQFFFSFF